MFSYEITNPTDARKGFFKLLEQVAQNHEVYIVNRRDGNRLLNAIAESQSGKIKPQSIAELKQEIGDKY